MASDSGCEMTLLHCQDDFVVMSGEGFIHNTSLDVAAQSNIGALPIRSDRVNFMLQI